MSWKNACPLVGFASMCAVIYLLTGFRFLSGSTEPEEEPAAVAEAGIELPEPAAAPEETSAPPEETDPPEPEETAETEGTDEAQTAEEPVPELTADFPEDDPPEPEPVPLVIGTAPDAGYFADALFIGDSRTVGLSEYCPELDEQATFYAKISLTVKKALDKPFIKTEDGRRTIEEMLREEQFGKIYIMLGINEIGGGSTAGFKEDYRLMLERIREAQPDAIIFIQSIMHVTKSRSDVDRSFNNTRINARNEALRELADEEHRIYYLDINEAVDDEDGALGAKLSFDDIHLKAASYSLWYEQLRTHAAVEAAEDGGEDAEDGL